MSDALRTALDGFGLGEFYDVLAANDVDVATLEELTEADLRELGLTLGQRKRFLRARTTHNGLPPPGQRPGGGGHSATMVGERRQLTSMFCDLVGSTPLSLRLDPEDFSEIIRVFQDTCAGVITRGGGYVARYQGDGVLAHFGFPRAREDDAQSAARAALAIVAKIGQLRAPDGEPLSVRVGVATGLVVVVGDYGANGLAVEQSIVGETLNLAARLQSAAAPGEIIISEATQRLCGGMFEYEQRGDIVLKGFPEPVTMYRLIGEGSAQNRFDARTFAGLNPFVGRGQEFDALIGRWNAARAGRGQIVLVSGEPGIGKSRLALTVLDQIRRERAEIIRWNCAAHLANRAMHPIVRDIEMRAGLSRTLSADAARAAVGRLVAASPTLFSDDARFLHDLLGMETETRSDLDAAGRARRIYAVLARWLAGVARDAPVLILIEDAHWADAATLEFLATLIDRIPRLSVMLLITHRPEFVAPWPQAKQSASIVLDPLDADAGAQLLAAVMRDHILPSAVVRTILDKAGGVPLFVEELAHAVLDAVPGLRRAVESPESLTIPATLQDSLMARLDQLGEAKELAQIGSVIGREFTSAMLRAVAPDHPDIDGGLRRLCESGLARENFDTDAVGIAFHHALIQDAAYESLLRKRRRELHRAVAEAMLSQDPAFAGAEPEEIARHCSKGGLAEPAVSYWLAAGMHALDRAANAPAITHLRSALEQMTLLPETAESARTELQIQMALAPATSAIYGWAARDVETACRRAIAIATQVSDGEALCGATWGLWTNYFIRGEMDSALDCARSVSAMADETGSTFLALAAAHALTYSHYSRGEYREALAAGEAGLARYDRDADLLALRTFQLSPSLALPTLMANVHWFLDQEAEADAALERAHAMAEALQHPPALVHCLCVSSYYLVFARRWDKLAPIAERAVRISVEEGFRFWEHMARVAQAFARAADGDRDGAIRAAIDNITAFKATGASIVMSQFEPRLGELLIDAGEARQAEARLSEAIADAHRRAERTYLPELHRVRAVARGKLGDFERAAEDARAALSIAIAQGAPPLVRNAEATLRGLMESRENSAKVIDLQGHWRREGRA
ncbi:AAA ATPase-like protein [Roseiarcus fermentans]|uniref:AAA ATPase-like protein n=1 Tax=Roseiarcus fermentans TaxID=1473586 RepID=A0A366F2Z6_9HYPH|nr:adenylate/guanylate cyclase domain-containing protein [Roseiarcus fermentans]RBP09042.1 AAA ATPase-like protein [Roseiarcus fermentans]